MKLCLKVLTKLMHIVLFFLNEILVLSHWSLFKAKVLKITKMRKYVLNIFGPYLRQKSLKLPK